MVPLPLFGALPGGLELLIIGFIFLLIFSLLLPVGMAYWVYQDAKGRRDTDETLWALATVLAGLFVSVFGAGAVVLLYLLIERE
jgi:xanthine/uracil permease